MTSPDLTVSYAIQLIEKITSGDDAAHANELLRLVHGIADPKSVVAVEVEKHLYSLTPDFETHFEAYMKRIKVA